MKRIVCAVHQPDFFPWLGFFDKIKKSDCFVILDDAQFPKKTATDLVYMNRVKFNFSGKSQWFTAPIKRKTGIWNINETYFMDNQWRKKLKTTLQMNYAKSKNFLKFRDDIFSLIDYESNYLVEYNLNAIKGLCKILNIEFESKCVLSSSLNINAMATQRLVDIVKKVNANIYISGLGGKDYLEEHIFVDNDIELQYNNFLPPLYKQTKSQDFIKGLSVIDYIFEALDA